MHTSIWTCPLSTGIVCSRQVERGYQMLCLCSCSSWRWACQGPKHVEDSNVTYMFILKCALKLVEEIILYYDARSKKHQNIFLVHPGMNYFIFITHIRKIAKCFVISIRLRPSVRMEQLGSHWTDFHEIWYLIIFRKTVEKIQVSLKSDKNNGTLHEDQYTS